METSWWLCGGDTGAALLWRGVTYGLRWGGVGEAWRWRGGGVGAALLLRGCCVGAALGRHLM